MILVYAILVCNFMAYNDFVTNHDYKINANPDAIFCLKMEYILINS